MNGNMKLEKVLGKPKRFTMLDVYIGVEAGTGTAFDGVVKNFIIRPRGHDLDLPAGKY